MTCAEARDRFEEHRRGILPPDEARALEAHLAGCAACRQRRADDDRLAAGLAALPRPAVPPELRRRLRRLAPPSRLRRFVLHPASTALAAAAAVLLLLAPGLLHREGPDPVQRLLESGVAEHRRVVLQLGPQPPTVSDAGPLFAQIRVATEIQLPPVMAGAGDLRLLTARPTLLADRKAALASLSYPSSPVTTYFVLPGQGLPMPDRFRVQIDRYRPYVREVEGYRCVYWKQGETAYLMVSGLDLDHTRKLFVKMRQTL